MTRAARRGLRQCACYRISPLCHRRLRPQGAPLPCPRPRSSRVAERPPHQPRTGQDAFSELQQRPPKRRRPPGFSRGGLRIRHRMTSAFAALGPILRVPELPRNLHAARPTGLMTERITADATGRSRCRRQPGRGLFFGQAEQHDESSVVYEVHRFDGPRKEKVPRRRFIFVAPAPALYAPVSPRSEFYRKRP